ncbi:monovalent cation/proton antiporter, MnhG/PhaG subunit [Thermoanaerobacter ethanolicus JW 200]|uniref:Monovalent cation/proton antiporter, MnhG/PhaG subunit n=1 Tax=Thermoanaerobacter siderophilus SR4 TaxID=880478 RepID=I9KTH3_9THEO|nr:MULTISPECIES: monovalent cation/H(+) antiporter subunit G [Thermoanaerobacter]EGD52040.1 monovalent cation/proton antiporter, MnhG/PhaG subunit [Thermoanaerobacter ethanolicus JW 200]EIW00249.1 monovalent cation/proton antiporter, MnhG/PhaG subunit [Thermoanaerobacter siderophilus SR4]UZQ83050.1 monovalent cation/H(+) antiporter subunit G [Thermoanaerobacter sp. RKWS2]
MQYIGYFFLLIGAVFLALAGLGIYRMPDVLNQSQAGTKASTMGIVGLFIGFAFLKPLWAPKLILMALFFLFTSPIASHAICKAAIKRNKAKLILKENAFSKEGE